MSTAIMTGANTWLKDLNLAGEPTEPLKRDGRAVFAVIDAALGSLGVNGAITVKAATRAALYADLAHGADTLAVVYNDSTSAYNGIYAKAGSSGAGSWSITNLALPSTFAADLAEVLVRIDETADNAAAAGAGAEVATEAAERAEIAAAAAEAIANSGQIEAGRGRAGLYGFTQPLRAGLFAAESSEQAFVEPYYRQAYEPVTLDEVAGWGFTGGGAYALGADGRLALFAPDTPRITSAGLAVAAATTNLALYSNALDNAAWTKSGTGVTANAATAPDGTATADRMVPTAGGGTHSFAQSVTVSAGRATFSVYAKADQVEWLAIQLVYTGDNPVSYFNVADAELGTVATGSAATSTIEVLAGGWRRLRISVNVPGGGFAANVYACSGNAGGSYVANGTDGIYLWGAQIEQGGLATNLVPTTGATASSVGDAAEVLFAPEGDFTIMIEADAPASDGVARILASVVGSVLEQRIVLYRNEDDIYALQVYNGSGLTVAAGVTDGAARRVRAAFASRAGETRAVFDAGEVLSIATARPEGLLRLWLGALAVGQGGELNGAIRARLIWSRAATDAELIAMTRAPVDAEAYELTQAEQALVDRFEQALTQHQQDDVPHALPSLRRLAEETAGKSGVWSVVAADTFTGSDGALSTVETGGQTWVALSGNAIHRIGGLAKTPSGTLRGTAFLTGFKDGQLEADLYPGLTSDSGTKEASLYFRYDSIGNHLMLQRTPNAAATLYRFIGGASTRMAQVVYRPYVAGERWKIRMVGPRIWVYRIAAGVEELLYDLTETQWQDKTGVGIRLDSTATADNFRFLGREAL